MRLTEFWKRMDTRFGRAYARSVASDYRLPKIGTTVDEALVNGVDPKAVWEAICAEFDVPGQLR